ncbi:MAG: hypothetical protein V8Q17_09125 [Acutalibacteraceae bacterium]
MRGKTMEHAQKRKINFKGILTSSRTKRVLHFMHCIFWQDY